jgi:hypothetical protein
MQLCTETNQPSDQQSRLTGTVTDEDGEPLRGLYVKVVRDETVVCWDETDCNGRYELAVPSGVYDVKFCSLAYHELVDPSVLVAGACTNLDAVLVPII